MQLGFHTLTAEQYHADPCADPSLSAGIAKILLSRSPFHAWCSHPRLNPAYESVDKTRFDLGTAAHSMLLEDDDSRLVVIEADDWRTKAAKEARDAAWAEGKSALLSHQVANVRRVVEAARKAIKASQFSYEWLEAGKSEVSAVWLDGGVWCRSRFDRLGSDVIFDYKTTESAAPEAVIRQIGAMSYDVQAEFYRRGAKAITGRDHQFVFLFQEISPPYACTWAALSNAYVEIAEAKVVRAIDTWRQCITSNQWPSYSQEVHYAEPPAWVVNAYIADQANW